MTLANTLSKQPSRIDAGLAQPSSALESGTQYYENQTLTIAISNYSIPFDGVNRCATERDSEESLISEPKFRTDRVFFQLESQ